MNDYNYYKKIWCEMVSGIVFKSRLDEYRKLYEYISTNKDYLHGVSTGKYEELLKDEIDYIITSISLGKKFTKDYWGVELKIIDDTDLQQDYYLVRKVNKLFEIVYTDDITNIINADVVNGFNCNNYICIYHNESSSNKNLIIKNNDTHIQLYGTIAFSNIEKTDFSINYTKPSIAQMVEIIQNTKFMLGEGVLDLNYIAEKHIEI